MALTGLTKVTNIGINTTTIPTLGGSRNTGVVTATTFVGDGSGLSGVTGSGAGVIVRDGGSLVGTAGTINFGTNLNVSAISAGIVTVTNAASATALTNLSDVTVSSASNGQILKHNGSVFVNTAETTYSQSSVASGSNVNLRLTDSGGTNDDILITAGSNITFSSVTANGFTIAASGGGGGGGLSNVVEDTSPELGGNLNLNNKFITGSGGINVSGVTTSTSFVGNITGNVTGNADTATNSTHVYVTENGSTNENNLIAFVEDAQTSTGNHGLEMDGDLTFNPSTGNLTATKFTGSGVALTGVVTSIVAGANITLTGGPTGIVTIASSGGGGGGVSLANGVDNRVVTATGAAALNGEANLTWDGTTLAVVSQQTVSGSVVVGAGVTLNARGINAVGTAVTAGRFHADGGSFQAQTGISNQGFYLYNGNSLHLGISYSSSANINQFRGNASGTIPLVIDDFSYISINPKSSFVRLQHAESTKLVTDVGGVKITGVATATGFSGPLTGNVTGDVTGNADTATTATNITVSANNSTDETVYPIFVDGTGNKVPESDTSLTYNPSSNNLTAGSFVKSGGSSSQFLKADGSVDSNTYLTSGSYLENVSEDSSPQLGGNLDLNSKNITGTGNAEIVGVITATSAVKTWTLGASGTDHYTFVGDGFTSATNDPDIYLERGKRYAFLNNSGGNHPFQIQSDTNSTAYNTGVTRNNATSGYITFNVPWDAPARLYYKCSNHSNMLGNFYIRGAGGSNDNVGVTTFSGDVFLTAAGANRIHMRHVGGGKATIKNPTGANLTFGTNNNDEEFVIVNGGNVGVNTDLTGSQTWRNGKRLEIFGGSGNVTGELHLGAKRSDANQSVGSINFFDNGQDSSHKQIALIEADKAGSTSNKRGGDLIFFTKPDNVANPAERMRIDDDGHARFQHGLTGLVGGGVILCAAKSSTGTANQSSYKVDFTVPMGDLGTKHEYEDIRAQFSSGETGTDWTHALGGSGILIATVQNNYYWGFRSKIYHIITYGNSSTNVTQLNLIENHHANGHGSNTASVDLAVQSHDGKTPTIRATFGGDYWNSNVLTVTFIGSGVASTGNIRQLSTFDSKLTGQDPSWK